MTALVAWLGVDNHPPRNPPASLYLASDSRISWDDSLRQTWDSGRKVFAVREGTDLFGYCGDVLFPSLVLGQIVEMIDDGVLYSQGDAPTERSERVRRTLEVGFRAFPRNRFAPGTKILYCCRWGQFMQSTFHAFSLSPGPDGTWTSSGLPLPSGSGIIAAYGSGRRAVCAAADRWNRAGGDAQTSRYIFGAFCEAIASGSDGHSGGPPQLVGLYRKGPSRNFGVIVGRQRYLFGLPVEALPLGSRITWHDTLLQRCDPETLDLLPRAQRHARPRNA